MGVQFHPEFKSRPGRPSAPFLGTSWVNYFCLIILLNYISRTFANINIFWYDCDFSGIKLGCIFWYRAYSYINAFLLISSFHYWYSSKVQSSINMESLLRKFSLLFQFLNIFYKTISLQLKTLEDDKVYIAFNIYCPYNFVYITSVGVEKLSPIYQFLYHSIWSHCTMSDCSFYPFIK